MFRNIPPLLVILFWYQGVLALLPAVRDSYVLPFGSYLNSRGFYFPKFIWGEGAWLVLPALSSASRSAGSSPAAPRPRQMATGQQFPVFLTSLALIIGLPAAGLVLAGFPLTLDFPQKGTFNLTGGSNVKPEFLSLFLALSFYTAVLHRRDRARGHSSASAKGQTEAYSALGLQFGARAAGWSSFRRRCASSSRH